MVMRGRRRGRKRLSAQDVQDPGTTTGAEETSTGAVTLVTSTPPPEDASEQLPPETWISNDTPPAGVAVLPQDEEQGHDQLEPDGPAVAGEDIAVLQEGRVGAQARAYFQDVAPYPGANTRCPICLP